MRDSLKTVLSSLWLLVAALSIAGIPCRLALAAPDDHIFADGFEASLLLQVTNAGGGSVTSDTGGIDCGATCSAMFQDGSLVTLQARTTNGSGYSFTGWSGDCAGSFHDCTLTMSTARSVTATFTNQPFNLAFVSSATFATTLGSAGAYDAQCNILATNAGINNVAGNAYVAWVSSFTTTAAARLGTARGWVRLDGAPFADDANSLLTANKVFNAIDRDEAGASVIAQPVLTGTQSGGSLSAGTCSGWTSTSGSYGAGDSSGGPIAWTFRSYANCTQAARIDCLMNTLAATLSPTLNAGRKIWITSAAFLPGSATTPDQACNADRPSGVASAKAHWRDRRLGCCRRAESRRHLRSARRPDRRHRRRACVDRNTNRNLADRERYLSRRHSDRHMDR